MADIDLKTKINILLIGIAASVLVFFIIYAAFARTLFITAFENLEKHNNFLLWFVLAIEGIAVVAAIITGFFTVEDIPSRYTVAAATIAFGANTVFLLALSYIGLFITRPDLFEGLTGFDVVLVFPTVILYFSIIVLGHPIYFVLLTMVLYFPFFIFFLEFFYNPQ